MVRSPSGHQGPSEVHLPAGNNSFCLLNKLLSMLRHSFPLKSSQANCSASSIALQSYLSGLLLNTKSLFSDGNSPVCSDGSTPQKPERPPRGGPCSDGRFFPFKPAMRKLNLLYSQTQPCFFASTPSCGGASPVCPDGSALSTEGRRPCTGGRSDLEEL